MPDVVPMGAVQPFSEEDRELAARQYALSCALQYNSMLTDDKIIDLATKYYNFIANN